MNYTTLQAAILAQAVHSELTAEVVDFIRRTESMIRRDVRGLELRTTLVEADRSADGVYNLSGRVEKIRAIYAESSSGDTYALENVGLAGIRMLPASAAVQHYAVSGQTVELRGVPGTGDSFELVYRGWPEPLATTATNELLTNHEDLYLYGALFHLYNHTQDLELAQSSLSVFRDAAEQLNRLNGRLTGGGSTLPAYNFGHVRTGRSY